MWSLDRETWILFLGLCISWSDTLVCRWASHRSSVLRSLISLSNLQRFSTAMRAALMLHTGLPWLCCPIRAVHLSVSLSLHWEVAQAELPLWDGHHLPSPPLPARCMGAYPLLFMCCYFIYKCTSCLSRTVNSLRAKALLYILFWEPYKIHFSKFSTVLQPSE